jgi:hypothetical protein
MSPHGASFTGSTGMANQVSVELPRCPHFVRHVVSSLVAKFARSECGASPIMRNDTPLEPTT